MAGYRLTISAPSASPTADRIERLGTNAQHARTAFEAISDILLTEQREKWGKGWRKLSPSTKAAKARKGEPKTTMVASGALRDSLTVKGAPHQILKITDEELTFGTSLFYAKFHDSPRKSEPKRKVIRLTKQGRQEIVKVIASHITEGA